MSTEEMVTKYQPYIKQEGIHRPNIEGQMELQRLVENYVLSLQEKVENKEIEPSTCVTRLSPVKLLFDMNDIVRNWKKINKLLPRAQ